MKYARNFTAGTNANTHEPRARKHTRPANTSRCLLSRIRQLFFGGFATSFVRGLRNSSRNWPWRYGSGVSRKTAVAQSSLRQFGLRIPRPLDAIILKCLQKNPSQRYASALDLKNDLLAFASGQPVSARPTSLLANLEYQLRRHVLAASVSGSAVLLLLVLASMIVLRSWSQSTQIIALQTDNDRLHRLVALQYQLMRGRTNQDSVAIQLAASGDLDRAAFYAAEAIESGQVMDDKVIADLLAIVANYSERHPSSSRDVESQEQLIARVVAESESVHTAILRARAVEQTGTTSREREPSREIGAQK